MTTAPELPGTQNPPPRARRFNPRADGLSGDGRRDSAQLALLIAGVGTWIYALTRITPSNIKQGGLLLGANHWFAVGIALVLCGFLLELSRPQPRTWMLWVNAVCLIAVIQTAVPIIFGVPEYGWVYKHIGIISAFQHYGRVTDPTNIYDEWPTLFTGVAWICSLAHVNAVSFAEWAPVSFELGNALLLVSIFRLLVGDRRVVWLALVMYEGLVAWVGQDYLSPQAFAYFLWLGIVLILLKWLRRAPSDSRSRTAVGRLRTRLLRGVPPAPASTRAIRWFAVGLIVVIYVVIVTAHQLTPYIVIASVAGLVVLGLIRRPWLPILMALIAGGFLALHYHLIATEYGGLFGGDPITNAGGAAGTANPSGYQRWSARLVLAMMGLTWLASFGVVVAHRRRLGEIALLSTLAFAPFVVVFAGSYGGEAIYRVYLFSMPWCALLLARSIMRIQRTPLRWAIIVVLVGAISAAGLQGLYDPVRSMAFTRSELTASDWIYSHLPRHSMVIYPDDNFPFAEASDYRFYTVLGMPGNSLSRRPVELWLDSLGDRTAYMVISKSMYEWAQLYGTPTGIGTIETALENGWLHAQRIYKNDTTAIYRFVIGPAASGSRRSSASQPGTTRAIARNRGFRTP